MRWSAGYSHFTEISSDDVSCKFIGRGGVADVGGVITNIPLEENCRVAYFEICILHCTPRCSVTVGLADRAHSLNKVLGSDGNSFGYRGEDGKCISDGKRPETFGSSFGVNDVIGCGIDFTSSAVFFTKNGAYVGSSGSISSAPLRYFPAVSMCSPGDEIRGNFGTSPFLFDVADYVSSVIEEEVNEISSIPTIDARDVVARYFEFGGFAESAASLPTQHPCPTLASRARLRDLIITGNISLAIGLVEACFPKVFFGLTAIYLYSQNVVELVRNGEDLNACIFLKEHLSPYKDEEDLERVGVLTDTCSLFCYEQPITKLPHIFSIERRDRVWQHVNRAIQGELWDPIELLVRQIVVCKAASRTRGMIHSAKSICSGPVRTRGCNAQLKIPVSTDSVDNLV